MSNPTNPFSWQMPTATDLVTDLPADFEVFGQAVATSLADLLGGTTGQVLSKTTNADMDFTWVAANPGDITGVTAGTGISGGGTSGTVTVTNDMATTITASGDIVVGTGSGTYDNLPIGTTGDILTADTTVSPYKVKWAAPAAGGGLTLISETVASGLSSLSFTSLGSYKQLLLMWAGVRHSANGSAFTLRFNNNSTAGAYITSGASFIDNTVNSSMASNDSLSITAIVAKYAFGENASLTSDAHNSGGCILLDNYTSATKSKTYTAEFGYYNDTDGKHLSINCSGYFGSQTAVTSIDIVRLTGSATFSNINNTTIRLYGVQ